MATARRVVLALLAVLSMVAGVLATPMAFGAPPERGGPKGGGGLGATLEAYDRVSESWTRGNTAGYAELQSIPFRLVLTGTPGSSVDVEIVHDLNDEADGSGVPGIDELTSNPGPDPHPGFAMCTGALLDTPDAADDCALVAHADTDPGGDAPAVVGRHDVPESSTQIGVYTWHRVPIGATGRVVLTWGSHLALGSHAYNGSALHVKVGAAWVDGEPTSLGNKDIPIPVRQILAATVDKQINGSDAPDPVLVGDEVDVTITVDTFGPKRESQLLTITDDLPPCMRYVPGSVTLSGATGDVTLVEPTEPGGHVVWTIDRQTNQTTVVAGLRAEVLRTGECTNEARLVSDLLPDEKRDDVTVPVDGRPDLTITKTGPAWAAPGATVTYRLDFANQGSAEVVDVEVVDVLPPGLTYAGNCTSGPGSSCDPVVQSDTPGPGETTLTFAVGTLAEKGSTPDMGHVTYDVTLPETGSAGDATFTNVATITPPPLDPPEDNEDDHDVTTRYVPDLSVIKECPAEAVFGTDVTFSLTFDNTAGTADAGATLVDDLPNGLRFVPGSATIAPSVSGGDPVTGGETLTWDPATLGTLVAGAPSRTITFQATVMLPLALTNTASITVDGPVSDANAADNQDDCPVGVSFIDVFVDATCTQTTAIPGGTVTRTLRYGNRGNAPAPDVRVAATLGGLTLVPDTVTLDGAPHSASVVGDEIVFQDGITLPAGADHLVSYEVRVPDTADEAGDASFASTASISTSGTQLDTANDRDPNCPLTVSYAPVLGVTKSVNAGCVAVVPGGLLDYTIDYENSGTAPAVDATLVDTLPPGTAVAGFGDGDGDGDGEVSGSTVTWDLGTLAVGETGSRTLTVEVMAVDGSQLENLVELGAVGATSVSDTELTDVSHFGAETHGLAFLASVFSGGEPVALNLGEVSSSAPDGAPAKPSEQPTIVIPGVGTIDVGTASSTSDVMTEATSTALVTTGAINLFEGLITADAIHGGSQSLAGPYSAFGTSLGSGFVNLQVNGQVVGDPTPGTSIPLGPEGAAIGEVVLQRETDTTTDPTVNGIRHFANTHSIDMLWIRIFETPAAPELIVTVGHASTDAQYPDGQGNCGSTPDDGTVSGRALTERTIGSALDFVGVDSEHGTVVLPPRGSGGVVMQSVVTSFSVASLAGQPLLSVDAAVNETSGDLDPSPTASSMAQVTGLDLLDGLVTATLLQAESTSTSDPDVATEFGFTFEDLVVNGVPIGDDEEIAPNTQFLLVDPDLPNARILVVLNEQLPNTGGNDTQGTINALHAYVFATGNPAAGGLPVPTVLQAEIIVASAHSDAHLPDES